MMAGKALRACVAMVVTSAAIVALTGCSAPSSALGADGAREVVSSAAAVGSGSDTTDTLDAAGSAALGNGEAVQEGNFPQNPSVELPDEVDSSIPDSAEFVSKDYVQDDDGTLLDASTGDKVTDPEIVGTSEQDPDPFAKTGGKRFIPETVADVREAIDETNVEGKDSAADGADGSVSQSSYVDSAGANDAHQAQATKLENAYGAYWGTYNGTQAFFQKGGSLFAQQAKGVIDVSEWQGSINWSKVKAAGVEGAIIRIGYGRTYWDKTAKRNISECKRLGIPFGIYLYSYASNSSQASAEAANLASMLKSTGTTASKLKYPVFYDLENWVSGGQKAPTSVSTNVSIVNAWYSKMKASGYSNLSVYSYTSLLNSTLNSSTIRSKTRWVAEYGPKMNYKSFGTNDRGWQYSSSGSVSGISGNVDINAFGNAKATSNAKISLTKYPKVTVANGKYYINMRAKDSMSVDITGASKKQYAKTQLYVGNGTTAQQFQFTKQSDGSYVIKNVNSGLVLDVAAGSAKDGAEIRQYAANGSAAQKWFIRSVGNGYALQSALGNWALDIYGARTSNKTSIRLYSANGSTGQIFALSSVANIPVGSMVTLAASANTKEVIDVPGASKSDRKQLRLYQGNTSDAQHFILAKVGNGVFTIKNVNSGKVLDVAANGTANGTVVRQYTSNGSVAQHWTLRSLGGGKYSFVGVGSGKALDIVGNHIKSGTLLDIYTVNGTTAQQFSIKSALAEYPAVSVPNGKYYINMQSKDSMSVDITGASKKQYAKTQIYSGNRTTAQQFQFTKQTDGSYVIKNVNSGLVLDIASGIAKDGAVVRQYAANGSNAQKWYIRDTGKGYVLQSALGNWALDIRGGKNTKGTQAWLYSFNGTAAQYFALSSVAAIPTKKSVTIGAAADNKMVIDIASASKADRARAQLYSKNGTKAQYFVFTSVGNGVYTIKNVNSGKVLEAAGNETSDKTVVRQYASNGTTAQHWAVRATGSGKYAFVGVGSGKALDIPGGNIKKWAQLDIYTVNSTNAQQFNIS